MAIREQRGVYRWDDEIGRPGQSSDGGWSDNLYRDNVRGTTGSGGFYPDDELLYENDEGRYENTFVTSESRRDVEESDLRAQVVASFALLGFSFAVKEGAPLFTTWWQEQARPFISDKVQKIRRVSRGKKSPDAESEVLESNKKVATALVEDRRQIMSQEEAMSRLIASVAARAYSEEQLRMVRNARVVGVDNHADLDNALSQIPAERLQAVISDMVKNPSLLEDRSLANLASMIQPRELMPKPVHREDPNS